MNRIRRKAERGAALLNLALAISLGILVTAGAFWVAAPALEKGRIAETEEFVIEVADAILRGWQHELNYASLDANTLYDRGMLRNNYWYSRGSLRSPLGTANVGTWNGSAACYTPPCYAGFRVSLFNLSTSACKFLATLSTEQLGTRLRITAVTTSAGAWNSVSRGTAAEIAGYCGSGNDTPNVHFYFS